MANETPLRIGYNLPRPTLFRKALPMRRLAFVFSALLITSPLQAQESAKEFFFKPNDRIVFLGDSITEQYQYSSTLELYLTTRMPKGNFAFLNAGIGGDTAGGGAGRFQAHVLDEKPTAITINFGMNDGGYGAFNPTSAKNFVDKTKVMLDMAQKAGVRVALCTPNAVDRRKKTNGKQYLETQMQFYAPLKELAAAQKVSFADQYTVTRAATEKMEVADPEGKVALPYPDGFHTASSGGLLMAHAILTQLNAPAIVTTATVSTRKAKDSFPVVGCKITDLVVTDDGVSFTRLDEALPLPIQKDWLAMLPYTNDLKDLNLYGLTVLDLKEGDYDITIDGVKAMKATAKDLAAGVNLGNVQVGPIYEQSNKVWQAINAKNTLVRDRFGIIRFNAPDWLADVAKERKPVELAKRMEKIEKAQAEIYKLAEPKPHKFEIKAAK